MCPSGGPREHVGSRPGERAGPRFDSRPEVLVMFSTSARQGGTDTDEVAGPTGRTPKTEQHPGRGRHDHGAVLESRAGRQARTDPGSTNRPEFDWDRRAG
jgi:hypothetical protein